MHSRSLMYVPLAPAARTHIPPRSAVPRQLSQRSWLVPHTPCPRHSSLPPLSPPCLTPSAPPSMSRPSLLQVGMGATVPRRSRPSPPPTPQPPLALFSACRLCGLFPARSTRRSAGSSPSLLLSQGWASMPPPWRPARRDGRSAAPPPPPPPPPSAGWPRPSLRSWGGTCGGGVPRRRQSPPRPRRWTPARRRAPAAW